MRLATITEIDRILFWRIEKAVEPFHRDLYSPGELIRPLREMFRMRANERYIAHVFNMHCYQERYAIMPPLIQHCGRKRIRIPLWIVRNFEKYEKLDMAELRRAWIAERSGSGKEAKVYRIELGPPPKEERGWNSGVWDVIAAPGEKIALKELGVTTGINAVDPDEPL